MVQQSLRKYGLNFDIDIRQQLEFGDDLDYRCFPHSEFSVVLNNLGIRTIKMMNYSLIPKWSKERKPKFTTYNARIESLCEKATWKEPIQSSRCLIGLTAFFESCYEGTHAGNVVQFKSIDGELLAAAGIYEQWVDKSNGEIVDSFAIITTAPSEYIKTIGHDRSPFFINRGYFNEWLSTENMKCADAISFLKNAHYTPKLSVKNERPLKSGWINRK